MAELSCDSLDPFVAFGYLRKMDATLESLRYPIGKFVVPMDVTPEEICHAMKTIAAFPQKLRHAVESLPDEVLDIPCREEGWSIRQLVHHCADSHLNAYSRFKLTLTEDIPVIKPFDQARWAELPDSRLPVGVSLDLLGALHGRWAALLAAMTPEDWARRFVHPEEEKSLMLRQEVMRYGWHCEHHLAHILGALQRHWP